MIRQRHGADGDAPARIGTVHLVGAGPGDPELLTLRAARLLGEAEIVVHDQLVGPGILDLIRPGAQRIFVGKRAGRHSIPQDAINRLLLDTALAGFDVVRLKGGDPGIFGRSGEEAEFLRHHGVRVTIVPGLTAALGCAAAIGMPLTHRTLARSLHIATGHCRAGDPLDLDWPLLADTKGTLVFYMGRRTLPTLVAQLRAAGLPDETPALGIENGTLPNQRCRRGTLGGLPDAVAGLGDGPMLIVVGQVVALAEIEAEEPDWSEPARAAPTVPVG